MLYLLKHIHVAIYILFESLFFICYSYFCIPCLFSFIVPVSSLIFRSYFLPIFSLLFFVRYYICMYVYFKTQLICTKIDDGR